MSVFNLNKKEKKEKKKKINTREKNSNYKSLVKQRYNVYTKTDN